LHERFAQWPGGAVIDSTELASAAAAAGLTSPAIYLIPLDGQSRVALDDGRQIYPASMIKPPLAAAAAAAVARGDLRWDEPVAVDAANMTVNDAPSPLEPGYTSTLGELVELMLSRSDNVATNVLYDRLDRVKASADAQALGLRETAFRRKLSGSLPLIADPAATGRNSHPARDAAALFERIAHGDVAEAAFLRRCLDAQIWNSKLSGGLESGDRFGHKTGDTDETSHDGGILELAGGGRFVLVVYTEMASNDATDARFAAFMRAIRPLLARA
jgi:beta-lactamase class A